MPTLPYLHFQGHCAQALAFYAEVFGSAPPQLLRYADGPEAPEDYRASDRVMHGEIVIWDGKLMASDFPPGVVGDTQAAVSVMQSLAVQVLTLSMAVLVTTQLTAVLVKIH